MPTQDTVYERLLAMATRANRLDALDAHLSRLVREAIDSETTVALLERRGRLLEGGLDRQQDAAEVYAKLLQLDPDHEWAGDKLRKSLRRSARYQELLIVIEKQLKRATDPVQELELLKEIASTWEKYLRNRWEAADAWKKVLDHAPDDEEATKALARVQAGELAQPDPEPTQTGPTSNAAQVATSGAATELHADTMGVADLDAVTDAESAAVALAPAEPLTAMDGDADDAESATASASVTYAESAMSTGADAELLVAESTSDRADVDAPASDAVREPDDGLASLDADLDAPEELDLTPSARPPASLAARRGSAPPSSARAGSGPPPLPGGSRASSPPSPSLPAMPPPGRSSTAPPPLPSSHEASGAGAPPPLPPRKS